MTDFENVGPLLGDAIVLTSESGLINLPRSRRGNVWGLSYLLATTELVSVGTETGQIAANPDDRRS